MVQMPSARKAAPIARSNLRLAPSDARSQTEAGIATQYRNGHRQGDQKRIVSSKHRALAAASCSSRDIAPPRLQVTSAVPNLTSGIAAISGLQHSARRDDRLGRIDVEVGGITDIDVDHRKPGGFDDMPRADIAFEQHYVVME